MSTIKMNIRGFPLLPPISPNISQYLIINYAILSYYIVCFLRIIVYCALVYKWIFK
jgi:hypothetical protein